MVRRTMPATLVPLAAPIVAVGVALALAACSGGRPAWTFEPAGANVVPAAAFEAAPTEHAVAAVDATAEPVETAEPTQPSEPSESAEVDDETPAPARSPEPTASALAASRTTTAAAPATASVRIANFRSPRNRS